MTRLFCYFQGLKCEVIPSTYEENLDPKDFPSPAEYVTETARNKVLEVADRLSADALKPDLIIGCDTTVAIDGTILGKPKDQSDAFNMLSRYVICLILRVCDLHEVSLITLHSFF